MTTIINNNYYYGYLAGKTYDYIIMTWVFLVHFVIIWY